MAECNYHMCQQRHSLLIFETSVQEVTAIIVRIRASISSSGRLDQDEVHGLLLFRSLPLLLMLGEL